MQLPTNSGKAAVNRIYMNLAILDVTDKGLKVKEMAPGVVSFEWHLQAVTEAKLIP